MSDEQKSSGRAWLVSADFRVSGERYAKVRPNIATSKGYKPDMQLGGIDAALCFAREQSVKKLGPVPARGMWMPAEGAFIVRWADGGKIFIVEGPPAPNGALPCWGDIESRVPVDVEGEPNIKELVEQGA